MDNKVNDIIVKDFNDFIEKAFDAYLFSDLKHLEADNEQIVEMQMLDFISTWEGHQIAELDNISPREYINSLSELKDVTELFMCFCENSMERTPNLIVEKIYSFGVEGLSKLAGLLDSDAIKKNVSDYSNLEDSDIIQTNIIHGTLKAIEYLRERASSLCANVIDFIENCNKSNELFLEAAAAVLSEMNKEALLKVADHIEHVEEITELHEYMLLSLAKAGYEKGGDEIYKCLRNSFKRMSNKVIGAHILADYGDGRAVTLLRKYAIDNKDIIDEDAYLYILGAIEKLGGEVKDLLLQRNYTKY